MRIYFDMDGTIANFYQGEWLNDILNENVRPYANASVMVNEQVLLNLIAKGYELAIISWLAKDASKSYDKQVRQAKKDWLKRNYPNVKFSEIHIVKYGRNKHQVANIKNQILVDDEQRNRDNWNGLALEPKEVFSL